MSLIKKYSTNDLFFDIGGGSSFISKAIEKENIHAIFVEPGQGGALNSKKEKFQILFVEL